MSPYSSTTAVMLATALFLPLNARAGNIETAVIEPCPIEQVSLQVLPDDCEPPPPPPPPSPPAKPSALWYTPFSESTTVRVHWRPVSNATYYRLNRISGGVSSQVYSGSATVRDVAVTGEGNYQFTVSACNSGGCSSTTSQAAMAVSYGPRADGQAPITGKAGAITMQEFVPQIGMGFDRLRQELVGEICLDMSTASVQTLNNRAKNFNLSLSKSREEYFRSLNMEENLSVGGAYAAFTGSFSGKKSLAYTAKRIEDSHILTASFIDRYTTTQISNGATLPFGPTYKGWLLSGLPGHFRNTCGDAFVSSYDTGREVTLTFQMTSDDFSSSEIRTKTSEMKIAIGSYVSGGYSSSSKSQIETSYSKYNVQVYVYSTGSGATVATLLTLGEGLDYLRRFEQEPTTDLVAFNHGSTDYVRPVDVAVGQWPDYKPKRNSLLRWYRFDDQVGYRCMPFDLPISGGTPDTTLVDNAVRMNSFVTSVAGATAEPHKVCHATKLAIQSRIQACEDTNKWGECIEPDSPVCAVPGSSLSCLEHAKQLPVWVGNDATLRLYRELGTGLVRDCADANANICLASPTLSIVDLRPKAIDCSGSGCPSEESAVTTETVTLRRAENASNTVNTTSKCLSAYARICRPGMWGGTAKIDQYQTLHGLQMMPSREYSF